ncbi:MAG TPA: hypothetical protein VMJ72_02925 [Candidatus Paceibacterota bacterium]|nr:hypothetical protein [Candidatus Paceibacterota bacterium]
MRWLHVGKTIVSHPEKSDYVLIDERSGEPLRLLATLEEVARLIRTMRIATNDFEPRFIKNDIPAIIWLPDGCKVTPDTVLECMRLDPKTELRELARLLRQ